MGLDMMAYAVDADFEETAKPNNETIAEWRKHPNLHGWMERLWRERTGNKEDDFNCQELELTLKDLKTLETDIRMSILPSTSGFFYGSDADDYYKGTDLAFVEDARSKIEAGKKVYYNSWW
jgi:hypothetical protein